MSVLSGINPWDQPRSVYDKTAAPTVNDDADDGYSPGSRWIDVTNDRAYVCLDSTVGAAVWTETTIPATSVTAASTIAATALVVGDDGSRGVKDGGWTITAGGDLTVGTRGDKVDLGGDGEDYFVSDVDGKIGVYLANGEQFRFVTGGVQFLDNKIMYFGNSNDAIASWKTGQTADALMIGVGASNILLLCQKADQAYNFGHAAVDDPTLIIHSANQATDEWISARHNRTEAVLNSGTGGLKIACDIGFYNTTPAAQQDITGSRGGNAALASLLTALATIGLITDSTT